MTKTFPSSEKRNCFVRRARLKQRLSTSNLEKDPVDLLCEASRVAFAQSLFSLNSFRGLLEGEEEEEEEGHFKPW